MRSSVSLCLVPWWSFAWKSFPALTRLFVQNHKERHTHPQTCPPVLCFWHTQVPIVRVMLGCKKSFSKPNNFLLISKLCKNIKNASTLPHHSQFQLTHTSHVSFTTVGHKLPKRRFSLLTNRRFEGYAHVGDAVPHTPLKHLISLNFQQHNINK